MATGYNVIQPNGDVAKQQYTTDEDRIEAVNSLLDKWQQYCEDNWITFTARDLYPPERRVKLFLDGLAYFSLLGNMQDIVTDYKNVVRGNSEIPISSCPVYIEDRIYGSGNATPNEAESIAFQSMIERLEEEAIKRSGKTKNKKQVNKETRHQKIEKIKTEYPGYRFVFATVNTKNEFAIDGTMYVIDESVESYSPKNVGGDALYDMDKIVVLISRDAKMEFFDQELRPIEKNKIKKFFPK